MIDWDAMRVSINKWAAPVVAPTPVIWADQNEPPPDLPYIITRYAGSNRIGDDFMGAPDGTTGIADLTGNRDFTLFIQALGTGAKNNIEKLRTSLQKDSVRASLRVNGLVFVQEVGANNVTDLVAGTTKKEERETLDIVMRVASADTDDLGVIEHVELTEKYLDAEASVVLEKTTTIN